MELTNETTQKPKTEIIGGLIPLAKWNDYYTFPTINALRQFVFHNTNNFNAKCVKKIGGKRLYIDVKAFEEWAKEQ